MGKERASPQELAFGYVTFEMFINMEVEILSGDSGKISGRILTLKSFAHSWFVT